jgi:microcystin degradation protein MlrC
MRIAVAGIIHEALNFSPITTTLKGFRVWHGTEILGYPGVSSGSELFGIEVVPILVAESLAPSGVVEQDTYVQFRDEILRGLEAAGRVDGILLLFHGALLVEEIGSGETDLVRSIRKVIGNDTLISARLDLHANITDEFAAKTDIWAGFRTAPHRDQKETTERAMSLLVHCLRSGNRPKPAFVRLPILLMGEKATTDMDPMKSLIARAIAIGSRPGILNAEVLVGFGLADTPYSGCNIAVIAEQEKYLAEARKEAVGLAQFMWNQRHEFTFDQEVAPSVDEAIDRGLHAKESTVFISDSGDDPSSGTTGDVPYFLSRLVARQVPDAVFASIPDAEIVQLCFDKGVGATVNVALGGKLDTVHGDPVELTAIVEHLYKPNPGEAGACMVTLRTGGVRVLVTDISKVFYTLDDFRKAGVEPLRHKLVVVKAGYLFPELRDAAPREILALSPGYSDMDLTRVPYKYVTRPIFPLDGDFEWQPVIANVASHGD